MPNTRTKKIFFKIIKNFRMKLARDVQLALKNSVILAIINNDLTIVASIARSMPSAEKYGFLRSYFLLRRRCSAEAETVEKSVYTHLVGLPHGNL